jgi:S1-C subfamily serine protease
VLVIRAPSDSKLRLKGGDVVLSVDGREVATPAHLIRVLRSYEPGESFRLELLRMKKRETVQGTIAE